MVDTLTHRGPDDCGIWADDRCGLALGHRRLAVIDLSPAGAQPMRSPSERFVVCFNGEIYNHQELRAWVDAGGGPVAWKGGSDTESLVTAIDTLGLEKTLERTRGMFAFALWDRRDRVLHLCRDRMGEKPLFYAKHGRKLIFASTLDALAAGIGGPLSVNERAAASFFRYGYVATDERIYQGVHRVAPGSVVSFRYHRHGHQHFLQAASVFWCLAEVVTRGLESSFQGGVEEAADQLEALLQQAISEQMVADVPVGAFLSGGIDSSTVVALMQRAAGTPVRTFTVKLPTVELDESGWAERVASRLATDHHTLPLEVADVRDVVTRMPRVFDEPFADDSQVSTYLVSSAARSCVTVVLTGDGGDEVFGGYPKYYLAQRRWEQTRRLPPWLRGPMAKALAALARTAPDAWLGSVGRTVGGRLGAGQLEARLGRLAAVLGAGSAGLSVPAFLPYQPSLAELAESSVPACTGSVLRLARSPADLMMFDDQRHYLEGDILVKVDRSAMAVSLETRIPFLDHRIIEFAWSLPIDAKFYNGVARRVLREVLYRHVPRELFDRPKAGFGVSIQRWLGRDLREWAEDLLHGPQCPGEAVDSAVVLDRWSRFLKDENQWDPVIWRLLMFRAWYRERHPFMDCADQRSLSPERDRVVVAGSDDDAPPAPVKSGS